MSRSLGALLGFDALAFKLETCQPTGSWLDRAAAALVRQAVAEGVTGLCIVDGEPLVLPLAVQCARAGLRLVVLRSGGLGQGDGDRADAPGASTAAAGWLAALGARHVAVQAGPDELVATAGQIAAGAGLRLVGRGEMQIGEGLEAVIAEIEGAGLGGAVLAASTLTGAEPAFLAAIAGRHTAAVPLPLDDLVGPATGRPTCPSAVVGDLQPMAATGTESSTSVLSVAVTGREADAARVLLAREEGLIVSMAGAAALAALVRAVRDDRARRPRERRFPRQPAAVVVLTGDPPGVAANPPRAADAIPGRAVTLAELVADPLRLLVEPPGSGNGR
jgi:threonine synthase